MSLLTTFMHFFIFLISSLLPSNFYLSKYSKWLIFLSVQCTAYAQSAIFSSCVNGISSIHKSNGESESTWSIPIRISMDFNCTTSCFVSGSSIVLHFSLDDLQNLIFYCSLLSILLVFILSYVERSQVFSANQSRLCLYSFPSSCSPHILLLISLIDP